MENSKDKLVFLILRIGLSFAFIYAAIAASISPSDWIGYFPMFLRRLATDQILLTGWGIFETAIALWILSGKKIFLPSLAAAAALAGLIFTNLPEFDILFRDVTILAVAVALAVKNFPSHAGV